MATDSSKILQFYGYDLLLGSIATFYVFTVPYTKVEESFNVQAMHDILYHIHHIERYDHLEFPGVVPRTFIGALLVSILASPVVLAMNLMNVAKVYSLYAVRLVLGFLVLFALRFFRLQIKKKFGYQVEAFFVVLTAIQFHMLFYCTRPLPNILAFGLVNLAYGFWFKGSFYAALRCLMRYVVAYFSSGPGAIADLIEMNALDDNGIWDLVDLPAGKRLLDLVIATSSVCITMATNLNLLVPLRSISLWKALRCCIVTTVLSIGATTLIDSIMWRKLLWPELEVFWFNSVLNRSSEWGTHPFHWYFTSALPRSLLAAYPLFLLGAFLDRRVLLYVLPVFSFVLLYSKLPHKELRFIIGTLPIFNLSASVAASRIYNNRRKGSWRYLYIAMLGSFLLSLGYTCLTFLASYENYPSGHALKELHMTGHLSNNSEEHWVHIDTFSAMNGISRFCEKDYPWRYSKEEGICSDEFQMRNFTYLLNEHSNISGFSCLFSISGFSRAKLQIVFPPMILVKEPKVFGHGNVRIKEIMQRQWPGC